MLLLSGLFWTVQQGNVAIHETRSRKHLTPPAAWCRTVHHTVGVWSETLAGTLFPSYRVLDFSWKYQVVFFISLLYCSLFSLRLNPVKTGFILEGGEVCVGSSLMLFIQRKIPSDGLWSHSPPLGHSVVVPPAGGQRELHSRRVTDSSSSLSLPQVLSFRVRSVSVGEQWLQQQSAPCRSALTHWFPVKLHWRSDSTVVLTSASWK